MFSAMLPWLLIAALSGVIVGLIVGVFLASTLVKGHFSHFLTNTAKLNSAAAYMAQAHAQRALQDHDRIY